MVVTAAEQELQEMYKGMLPSLGGQMLPSTEAGGGPGSGGTNSQSSETANLNPPSAMATSTPPNFVPGSLTAGAHKRPIATPQTQARRQNTRGAKGKGTGRGSHRGKGHPPWDQQPMSLRTEFGPGMQSWLQSPEALHHLIRLVMRHEHQLMRLGQDTTLLFTFANRPHQVENLLPHLYHISRAWKEKMDSDQLDRRPKMSLRVTVLQSVILEVRTRTRAILQRQECQAPLVKKGWLQEQSWTYLRWDAAQQDLVPQPTRSSMSQEDLECLLAELQENISSEGALFRFQAHRQLAEEMTGHQLTFQAEIGLRSPGALHLYNNLLRLANLSHRAPGACAAPAALSIGADGPGLLETWVTRLKSLRLQNPHNLCYANSVVHSWLWTSTQLSGDHDHLFGALRQAFEPLLHSSHRALSLIDMLSWRPVFAAWTRPRDQHDAHEFFIHMQVSATAAQFDSTWEARIQQGARGYDIADSGYTRVGISLCLPNVPDTLENCIKSWCLQPPFTHALTHAPDTVCLHLQRYAVTDDAQVRKNSHEIGIEAGAVVHLPVFVEHTRLQWQPYRITSGVFHVGPHARAGHYSSLRKPAPGNGSVW